MFVCVWEGEDKKGGLFIIAYHTLLQINLPILFFSFVENFEKTITLLGRVVCFLNVSRYFEVCVCVCVCVCVGGWVCVCSTAAGREFLICSIGAPPSALFLC